MPTAERYRRDKEYYHHYMGSYRKDHVGKFVLRCETFIESHE